MAEKIFKYYEPVPEIIGMKTNIEGFFWGFGKCDRAVPADSFERCKIKVILELRPDKAVFDGIDLGEYSQIFRHFRAIPEKGALIFDQNVKRTVKLRYALSVSGNTVKLVVGKSYLKLVKTKLMYVHPVSYILFDVVSQLLLQSGMTTLYCSAVCLPDGKSAVFMAPPNTGKSLCALKLRKDAGAEIIAEDMAVTDGIRLWGAPNTNLYRNYDDKELMDFEQSKFRSKLSSVDYLAILQKGGSCKETASDDFDKKLLLINRYSLGYYYSPCVRVLSYYNDSILIDKAQNAEERILQKLQDSAKCIVIENSDPMRFSEQIMSVIQ